MASPQPTDAHIRIAHSIEEEIMMRDFTKRQRSILDLILRLSWGCGKKTAIIPRQKDFEIVGIGETKIKDELIWLMNARVIAWDKDIDEFGFNKDYDQWRVSIVPGFNKERFAELIHLNLDTSQNGKLSSQNGKPQNEELTETVRTNLPKREDEQGSNVDEKPVYEVSKESIKDITTTITTDGLPKTGSSNEQSGRLPGAPESDTVSDRLPGASDADLAFDEINKYYSIKTGRLANSKDYVSMTEVLDHPLAVPLDYKSRVEVIKAAIDRISANKPANSIKSFSYFKDGIIEEFKKIEISQSPGKNADGIIPAKLFTKDRPVNSANFNQRKYSDDEIERFYKDT
jgi:hypothetical protein